jgi:arylsulfatase
MKRALVTLFLIAIWASANAQNKPNVVIMLGDNVGYGDIGAYGAGEIRGMPTPRIDSIAKQGLRLTHTWSSRRVRPRARRS